jgi:DNA repair protein RecO (recombination protein O)
MSDPAHPRATRVQLAPAYVLHHQPYRDTSRILEVLTRDHGRLSLFARGVRAPRSRLAGLLRPFTPLLLSWSGRGDAAQLTTAEIANTVSGAATLALPSRCILPAFYLNELILKLTARHDPQPDIFVHYERALGAWKAGAALERELRLFEKRLLDTLGYGIDLGNEGNGEPIAAQTSYRFRPEQGLQLSVADAADAIPGSALLNLAQERLESPADLEHARRLLRAALAQCLEGRTLNTRRIARSLQSSARHSGRRSA